MTPTEGDRESGKGSALLSTADRGTLLIFRDLDPGQTGICGFRVTFLGLASVKQSLGFIKERS